jgi:FKBP-type peptidyl-prolyl cis-trans isomerase SlyD
LPKNWQSPRVSQVEDGKVVSIEYVLRDPSGTELDRSQEAPLLYLHGARGIVPGLEEALTGKQVGDKLEVRVPPEKGYGPKRKVKAQEVPRSKFPADVKLQKGMRFATQGPDGRPIPVWVTKVQGAQIYVTPEHPLAGVTLCFEVTVRAIRDATDEEKKHGHPHGEHGTDAHE